MWWCDPRHCRGVDQGIFTQARGSVINQNKKSKLSERERGLGVGFQKNNFLESDVKQVIEGLVNKRQIHGN